MNKTIYKQGILLTVTVFVNFCLIAQSSFVSGGWNYSGPGGSATTSVGQVHYTPMTGSGGISSAGVQQWIPLANPAIDLQITNVVSNSTPSSGDQIVFTVSVKNLSASYTASNVVVKIILDIYYLQYISHLTNGNGQPVGTWNYAGSGAWNAMDLPPGHTKTLTITCLARASGSLTAALYSFDQDDVVLNNNSQAALFTVTGSSGGGAGGIESHGSMALELGTRQFYRMKNNLLDYFNQPELSPNFKEIDVHTGIVVTSSKSKNLSSELLLLIPEKGPDSTSAHIVTPADLLDFTNAHEVFSVDYYNPKQRRMASILAMTTRGGEVYEHSKIVCDRLNGAELNDIDTVSIMGLPFIRYALIHDNGDLDYAMSFIAYHANSRRVIDNRWLNKEYLVPLSAEVYNFQIWSANPQISVDLATEVIKRFGERGILNFNNEDKPNVPDLFISRGHYEDGKLVLQVKNQIGAKNITLSGDLARVENGKREEFRVRASLNPALSQDESIEIHLDHFFDAAFTVSHDQSRAEDQLYMADGPWGYDYEQEGAVIDQFEIFPQKPVQEKGAFLLERNIKISGRVKEYLSLYRSIRPGNRPVDLSSYNQVQFTASGKGVIRVIVPLAHIDDWYQQPSKTVELSAEPTLFKIAYDDFVFTDQAAIFDGSYIVSVVFVIEGNRINDSDFDIQIDELKFTSEFDETHSGMFTQIIAANYPNPFSDYTHIDFTIFQGSVVKVILLDIMGREERVITDKWYNAGNNRLTVYADNLSAGTHLYKIITDHSTVMKMMTLCK